MASHLTNEWRALQRHVTQLEHQYADQMLCHWRGLGPAPDESVQATLAALREETACLLARALKDVDRRMALNECKLDGAAFQQRFAATVADAEQRQRDPQQPSSISTEIS